jgi:hypothetical protein
MNNSSFFSDTELQDKINKIVAETNSTKQLKLLISILSDIQQKMMLQLFNLNNGEQKIKSLVEEANHIINGAKILGEKILAHNEITNIFDNDVLNSVAGLHHECLIAAERIVK